MASFPTSGKRLGYKKDEVDAFLTRARDVFDGQGGGVTALDVRHAAFAFERGGYDTAVVDAALERLETVFAEREQKSARSKLGDSAWIAEARSSAQVIVNRLGRPDRQRFTRVNLLTTGYSVNDVDRFSRRLIRHFKDGSAVTVDDVRRVVFRPQRGGYSEAQVDLLLDGVTDVLLAVK